MSRNHIQITLIFVEIPLKLLQVFSLALILVSQSVTCMNSTGIQVLEIIRLHRVYGQFLAHLPRYKHKDRPSTSTPRANHGVRYELYPCYGRYMRQKPCT